MRDNALDNILSRIKIKFISYEKDSQSLIVSFGVYYNNELIESEPMAYNLINLILEPTQQSEWENSLDYQTTLTEEDIMIARLSISGKYVLQNIIRFKELSKNKFVSNDIEKLIGTEIETNIND